MSGFLDIGTARLGMVPLDRIVPRRENYKAMNAEELAALRKSVESFGFALPVVVRERGDGTYEMIDGHHRWKVAEERGDTELFVTLLRDRDGVTADEDHADLAMLVLNIQGQPIEAVHEKFLEELLERGIPIETLAEFTASPLEEPLAEPAGAPAHEVTGVRMVSKTEGPIELKLPRTPSTEALLDAARTKYGTPHLAEAILSALRDALAQ